MGKFNPTLTEFKKENPDQKILSFSWSLFWRLLVIVLAVEIAIWVFIIMMMALSY